MDPAHHSGDGETGDMRLLNRELAGFLSILDQ
jgi:hypothetical protein